MNSFPQVSDQSLHSRLINVFISSGEIASIDDTPFDFRTPTRIGERINDSFDGYDMMFIIEGEGKRPFGK